MKVSISILTKDRALALQKALASIAAQSFKDYEVVVVNDASRDNTSEILENLKFKGIKIISHDKPVGITQSRQEALLASQGEYVAILDDDDEWTDADKLQKQAEFLDNHPDYVLVGGGMRISNIPPTPRLRRAGKYQISKLRPEQDQQIRNTMLFRNNFFTSTVMFKREAAIKAGGFIKDPEDFTEDYDLWLRLGNLGKMHNFRQVFADYRHTHYNKARKRAFLSKQLSLISRHQNNYPHGLIAKLIMSLRLFL